MILLLYFPYISLISFERAITKSEFFIQNFSMNLNNLIRKKFVPQFLASSERTP